MEMRFSVSCKRWVKVISSGNKFLSNYSLKFYFKNATIYNRRNDIII